MISQARKYTSMRLKTVSHTEPNNTEEFTALFFGGKPVVFRLIYRVTAAQVQMPLRQKYVPEIKSCPFRWIDVIDGCGREPFSRKKKVNEETRSSHICGDEMSREICYFSERLGMRVSNQVLVSKQ